MPLGASEASIAALPGCSGLLGLSHPQSLAGVITLTLPGSQGSFRRRCTGSLQPCSSRLEANSWQKGGTAVRVGCRRGSQKPLLVLSDGML